MKFYQRKEKNSNHLIVIDSGETWIVGWNEEQNQVNIHYALIFKASIPMPRRGFSEACNIQITKVTEQLKSYPIRIIHSV